MLAILLGTTIRSFVRLPPSADAGIDFTARTVLEIAVFLLGASVDLPLLLRAGPALAVGILLLVVLGLSASLLIGRALGLPPRLSLLVACGNAICGNSAIAAVAPVIGAEPDEVVSSIAFTAALGVVVVVSLPFLIAPLGLSHYQYGVVAGLTVYSVPQVLAAAFPVSLIAGQIATLVKLVRVLLLGPVVLVAALWFRQPGASRADKGFLHFAPWFILGFLGLAASRALGLLPEMAVEPARALSGWLTVGAMAALGLGVDARALVRTGRSLVLAVSGSLAALVLLALGLVRALGIRG